ncbi:MAG: hypothetical protein AB1742_05770 [bacterium]
MKLTRSEIKVIYLALRLLEKVLPYEDDVEAILDKYRETLRSDEIKKLEDEVYELASGTEELKPLAEHL